MFDFVFFSPDDFDKPKCSKCSVNRISNYCVECRHMLCQTCLRNHQTIYLNHAVSQIEMENNSLYIICDIHQTRCKFICYNVVCLYCINRDHSNHPHNSLNEEINQIKQAIDINIKKYESCKKYIPIMEQNIAVAQGLFEQSLKSRKRKCMEDYIAFLNKEENVLRENFHAVTSDYKNTLNMENLDELKNINKMTEIELVLLKENIAQSILQLSLGNLVSFDVSLSDSEVRTEHPLGELFVDTFESVASDLVRLPSFEYNTTQIKMVSKATELFEELGRLYQNGKFM